MPHTHHSKNNLGTLTYLALIMLLVWLLVLYYSGLAGPFVLDDQLVFPSTQLEKINYESVMQTLTTHGSGIIGRPVSIMSLIINGQLFGFGPEGYKIANLAFHLINTLLVFLFIMTLIRALITQTHIPITESQTKTTALIATALWACHPLQVSTVMYIFQRHMLLSTMFTLGALIFYLKGRDAKNSSKSSFVYLFVLFPLSLLLALGSKENGILIIPYVLFIELLVYRFSALEQSHRVKLTTFFTLFILIPALAALAYFALNTNSILASYAGRDFTLPDRLRTELVVIIFYLKMILLPNLADLSFYHDNFTRYRHIDITVILSGLTILAMLLATYLLRFRAPLVAAGLGIFLIAHSLESTFIPLELVFEHRNYMALIGIALIAGCLVHQISIVSESYIFPMIALLSALLLTSGQTYSRNLEWSNELLLKTIAFDSNPDSTRVRIIYVTTLVNNGSIPEALKQMASLVESEPDSPSVALFNLATQCAAKQPARAAYIKALSSLSSASLDQDVATMLDGVRHLAMQQACDSLDFSSVLELSRATVQNSQIDMPSAFATKIFAINAYLENYLGNPDLSRKAMNKALSISPDSPDLLIYSTRMSISENDVQSARLYLERLNTVNRSKFLAFNSTYLDLKFELENLVLAESLDN